MWTTTLVFLFVLAVLPATASAQAAIVGSVRDPAGAPLSGVTNEAISPALIEGSRTTVTDASGRYRLNGLRPGIYRVRFAMDGWNPTERSGIEVTGASTATVDATFALTASQSVSVVSESAAIDVHSGRDQMALNGDLIRSIPTARSYNALLGLVPGVVTSVNDTVIGTATTSFPIHGGRIYEGRLLLDGLTVGSPASGNSATSYVIDVGAAQEVTFSTAGASAEVETAGLVMSIVPKSGSNALHGSTFGAGTGSGLQSNNLTQTLRAQGVVAPTPLEKFYDISGALGGPIRRDRIWYFFNAHSGGYTRDAANVFYNLNAGDPTRWLYSPDYSRIEYSDRTFENASGRITWRATPRNRVGVFWDEQSLCRRCTGATPGGSDPIQVTPEAVGVLSRPLRVAQTTWSSMITNGLVVDAGFSGTFLGVGNFERRPNPTIDLIRIVEQCTNGCPANGGIPGLAYRSQDFSSSHNGSYLWKASLSHVTGSHSLKVGYQHTLLTDDRTWFTNLQNLTYRVDNGVPNQLTESISPWVNDTHVGWDALFAQEQWTRSRVTLQGAFRFDRAESWFPVQQEGPSRFLPIAIIVPETRGVDSYKDITPRVGVTYDMFGSGRTALKVQSGKYLEGAGTVGSYANSNPAVRMPQTTQPNGTAGVTRSWVDANGNFVPDCDLLNPGAQDLRVPGGDLCGAISDSNFGKNVLVNNFSAGILNGWAVRPSDWDLELSIQQQIFSHASVELTYVRRWYSGFFAVDNLAVTSTDLTPYSVTAPRDPRLPGGGGYVISGLYDTVPNKLGQVANLVTDASQFGRWSQHFTGVDANIQVRQGTFILVAGFSSGQTVADNCEVR